MTTTTRTRRPRRTLTPVTITARFPSFRTGRLENLVGQVTGRRVDVRADRGHRDPVGGNPRAYRDRDGLARDAQCGPRCYGRRLGAGMR